MNIIVFSGAGLSAESGLKTFRGSDGLWCNHKIADVATPEGFQQNPEIVHSFYNFRRKELKTVKPNAAHKAIAKLQSEQVGNIVIITQNIDDLLERAGCKEVLHIHGELNRCRCLCCGREDVWLEDTGTKLLCPWCGKAEQRGSLRPAVVWFNEVPLHLAKIEAELLRCNLFLSVGTSGSVYPAASFLQIARLHGAKTVCFNLEEPQNIKDFDRLVLGAAGETFPKWVNQFLKVGEE